MGTCTQERNDWGMIQTQTLSLSLSFLASTYVCVGGYIDTTTLATAIFSLCWHRDTCRNETKERKTINPTFADCICNNFYPPIIKSALEGGRGVYVAFTAIDAVSRSNAYSGSRQQTEGRGGGLHCDWRCFAFKCLQWVKAANWGHLIL